MHATARHGLIAAGLVLSAACGAQTAPAPPAAARLKAPPPPTAPSGAASAPHSGLTRTVVEDDAVRIEETRLRGAPQRIVVRHKTPGSKDYEILVPAAGKDPSQDTGAAGKRAWSVLSF